MDSLQNSKTMLIILGAVIIGGSAIRLVTMQKLTSDATQAEKDSDMQGKLFYGLLLVAGILVIIWATQFSRRSYKHIFNVNAPPYKPKSKHIFNVNAPPYKYSRN